MRPKAARCNARAFALFLLAISIPAALPACARRDAALKAGDNVEVTGTVRRLGNEPWTELAIVDEENGEWYIAAAETRRLADYLDKTITVRGTLSLIDLVLANGVKIGVRRELSSVMLLLVSGR
jgi:hypothetical protein